MPKFEIVTSAQGNFVAPRSHEIEGDFFIEDNGTLTIQKGEDAPVAIFAPGQWVYCKQVEA